MILIDIDIANVVDRVLCGRLRLYIDKISFFLYHQRHYSYLLKEKREQFY